MLHSKLLRVGASSHRRAPAPAQHRAWAPQPSSSRPPHGRLQVIAAAAEADLGVLGLVLPALGAVVGGAAVLKFSLYSQLEVITAKMLGKYVPSGGGTQGARVIQLGGGTRELYYYPSDVVLVVAVGEQVNKGLMEQAGVTAAVPTQAKQQPVTDLAFQPAGSVDAVVALGVLAQLAPEERQQCLRECSRVLKAGAPLVFVEPLEEGGSPLRGLVGVSGAGRLATAQLEALQQDPTFSYVQWDVALTGQDPHAVGVAVRSQSTIDASSRPGGASGSSNRRSRQPKAAKGFTGGGSS